MQLGRKRFDVDKTKTNELQTPGNTKVPSPPRSKPAGTRARAQRQQIPTHQRRKKQTVGFVYNADERRRLRDEMDREKREVLQACKDKDRRDAEQKWSHTASMKRSRNVRRPRPSSSTDPIKTTISSNVFQWKMQPHPQFPTKAMRQEAMQKAKYCIRGLASYYGTEDESNNHHQDPLKAVVSDIDIFEERLRCGRFD